MSNYAMLANYCQDSATMGVTACAPTSHPINVDPKFQVIPVFNGISYAFPPYSSENKDLLHCGHCNGNHCPSNVAYNWPTEANGSPVAEAVYDKSGRRVSGYAPMVNVLRTPDATVNQTCSIQGGCKQGLVFGGRK